MELCLFHKKVGDHIVLMSIHMHDCYVIGKPELIKQVVKDIKKEGLKIKLNSLGKII
jgi:hypothetical protein